MIARDQLDRAVAAGIITDAQAAALARLWSSDAVTPAAIPRARFDVAHIYLVLGGIGAFAFLAHLSISVFSFSLLFPIVLSALGVGVIALGVLYHRRRRHLAAWLDRTLPPSLAALRPPHARGPVL